MNPVSDDWVLPLLGTLFPHSFTSKPLGQLAAPLTGN